MASQTSNAVLISQLAAILEKVILPKIQTLVFTKTVLLDKIPKNNAGVTFKNDKIYISATTSHHSGVAFTGASGGIAIGKATESQMVASAKYGYGGHMIWDSALEATKQKEGALIEYSRKLGMDLEMAFRRSLNRQLFGDGTGVLATVTSGASSTATHTVSSTRFLYIGQSILIGTKAEVEAGTADAVTITAINSKTSVTVSASITTATSDRIVTAGIYVGSAYQEIDGLSSLISDNTESAGSTVQGIARATNDFANAYVDSTSAVLTEAQIVDMLTAAYEYGEPDMIVTTPALKNKYGSILQGIRRITNTVDLAGGYKGLEVSAGSKAVVMVADYDCPTGTMFAIDPMTWSLAELAPMDYLRSGTGSVLDSVFDVDGNRLPAYQAAMKFYGNLVCQNFRANAKMTGKTAS